MASRSLAAIFLMSWAAGGAQAATFTVDTTADLADTNPGDGFCATTSFNCSLRAAIEESNAHPALDTVAFNVPGAGVHTFQTATMPVIGNPIVIDGFTQPGSQPNTNATGGLNAVLLIELTGGLSLRGGIVTVRGIVANEGALEFGSGPGTPALNILEGCYIGTDPTGTIARSELAGGVAFRLTDGPVRVGGTEAARRNLISGNAWGVVLHCATNGGPCQPASTIQGNLIGTDVSGTAALPNSDGVILISSGGVTIGGTTDAERNVISGNSQGIGASGANSGSPAILIQGNRIGVDATGVHPIPNAIGINFGPPCSVSHPNCTAPTVTIGGGPATANVIAYNRQDGVLVSGGHVSITNNVISQNTGRGLHLWMPPYSVVPLTGEIADNEVTNNGGDGIAVYSGTTALTIRANTITGNAENGFGLQVPTTSVTKIRLTGNAIADNNWLGIDLGDDGVTANDFLDQDGGPNDLMNFPVLARACANGGVVTVEGALYSRPNFGATVEIFGSATCDLSGYGEGSTSLATQAVTTDPGGNASFVTALAGAAVGDFITATATSTAGETSEFSQCVPVVPAAPPPPQTISGPAAVCAGTPFVLRAVAGAGTYQWFLNGASIAGANGLTYGRPGAVPADAGSYTVRASSCGIDTTSPPFALSIVTCTAFPLGLDVDRHAPTGTTSDLNGILEPAETVLIEPHYLNTGAAALALTGTATFTGPAGGTYALPDATADYGTVAAGAITDCFTSTGDCYRAAVSAPSRPALHWDATLSETTSGGDPTRQWPVHIGDTFADVPRTNPFYWFIEAVVHNNVTTGCSATDYCPLSQTTREQMAVFVLVAKEGSFYAPPACNPSAPRFADVPASSPFCRWIEELARRNVVNGCTPTAYCPTSTVARDQMAVFVLATKEAPGYAPPPCVAGSEAFADVPASSPFCRWVEELARRGVVAGCGNGNYCPTFAVTRGEMSVFLVATFGLLLYGP